MSRIWISGGVTVAILGVGAVVAVGQGGGSEEAPPSPGSSGPPAAREVDLALQSKFSVLRRTRTSDDVLEQEVAAEVVRVAPYGVNPALGRRAGQWNSDIVYVLPGNGSVCLVVDRLKSVSSQCVRTAAALEGYSVGTVLTHDGINVTGLAPDGVDTVNVELLDGTVRTAKVVSNVYNLTVDRGTDAVSYDTPQGIARIPIPMPEMTLGEEVDGTPVPVR